MDKKKKREIEKAKKKEIMESMDFHNPVVINEESADFPKWLSNVAGSFRFSYILKQIEKGTQFVVQIPEQFQSAFQAGDLQMTHNSRTGKLWPSLYRLLPDGKHEFVANLPVEESYVQGNPFLDLTANFQNMMLQRQLSTINSQLKKITKTVIRIEQGQYDDRVAELKSGFESLKFALKNQDETQINQELLLARRDIRNAQNKFYQTLKSLLNDYAQIPENVFLRYWKRSKNGYFEERQKEFYKIQNYWVLYINSTRLLAGSYEITGDKERAQEVIDNSLDDSILSVLYFKFTLNCSI